jgi:hypothetical protein
MPEFSFTVTGAPMISLKKPLGSLESPWASASGVPFGVTSSFAIVKVVAEAERFLRGT